MDQADRQRDLPEEGPGNVSLEDHDLQMAGASKRQIMAHALVSHVWAQWVSFPYSTFTLILFHPTP